MSITRYFILAGLCAAVLDASGTYADSPKERIYAGASIALDSTFFYSGVDAALYGSLHDSGWRLRFVGGAGKSVASAGGVDAWTNSLRLVGGYQYVGEKSGMAIYAGYAHEHRSPERPTPTDPKAGTHSGATIEVEGWHWLDDFWMISGWGQWSDPHDAVAVHGAVLRHMNDRLQLGLEASHYADFQSRQSHFGAAIKVQLFDDIDLWLSGGYARDRNKSGAYANSRIDYTR